jgi:hypothetical protein
MDALREEIRMFLRPSRALSRKINCYGENCF